MREVIDLSSCRLITDTTCDHLRCVSVRGVRGEGGTLTSSLVDSSQILRVTISVVCMSVCS